MTGLQTNSHVNGFGCYVKGGKVDCEKIGYPLYNRFRGMIWSLVASGGLILIINDK